MDRITATLFRNKVWRRLSHGLTRENVVRLARFFKNAFTKVFVLDCMKPRLKQRYPDIAAEDMLHYYYLRFVKYSAPPTVSGDGAQDRKRLSSAELLAELEILRTRYYEETGIVLREAKKDEERNCSNKSEIESEQETSD